MRRHVDLFTCDAPRCNTRWESGQRLYLEANGAMLDFCSWKCVTNYAMQNENEEHDATRTPNEDFG